MTDEKRLDFFKEKEEEIDFLIKQRRHKWRLNVLAYISYDDIFAIIKNHIYNKLHLYEPKKGSFARWCNRTISNQMRNQIRNNYGNLAPPCFGCPCNEGGNACGCTPSQTKSEECAEYAEWKKTKEVGYNLKLASSIDSEDYIEKHEEEFEKGFDFEKSSKNLSKLMKKVLSDDYFFVYSSGIMNNHLDGAVAKKLSTSASHVKEIKYEIYLKAREEVYKNEVIYT